MIENAELLMDHRNKSYQITKPRIYEIEFDFTGLFSFFTLDHNRNKMNSKAKVLFDLTLGLDFKMFPNIISILKYFS